MSDDYLYAQLFKDPSPTKNDKKEAHDDIINSLFAVELPPANKNPTQLKKKKTEEEENNYLNRISQSAKSSSSQAKVLAQRLK